VPTLAHRQKGMGRNTNLLIVMYRRQAKLQKTNSDRIESSTTLILHRSLKNYLQKWQMSFYLQGQITILLLLTIC